MAPSLTAHETAGTPSSSTSARVRRCCLEWQFTHMLPAFAWETLDNTPLLTQCCRVHHAVGHSAEASVVCHLSGSVIKGWDVGVASMTKGEKATLICRSDYAYGDSGSPPKIPGGATLNFEVRCSCRDPLVSCHANWCCRFGVSLLPCKPWDVVCTRCESITNGT